jgi:hypothetical protein
MKFLFILEQIRIQVAKYSEFWSLNINRVHPYVPSLTTPPPSPHNRVQNKHVLHRCRVLYLRAVQRVLKPNWDSRRLDWTRLVSVGVYAALPTTATWLTTLHSPLSRRSFANRYACHHFIHSTHTPPIRDLVGRRRHLCGPTIPHSIPVIFI